MYRLTVPLALLAMTVPTPARAQLPAGFKAAWRALTSAHRDTLRAAGIVGATLAFVRDGRIVAADYYGMADLATSRPVDEHTIYHWASITKTFTAVSVMQLRDRQLLSLDDPIVNYVPELRKIHDPYGPVEAITLRQLISHSAGFRNATWPWGGAEPWQPFEPTEWSQLVAMMPYTRLYFAPGSRFSYSNPGIIFLARALQRVTGDVYEAYVDKNIFRVLAMRESYFDRTPWHLLPHRSNNYRVENGKPVANGLDFNTGITVSNGGLNAPVTDLAKWLGFLMGRPADRRTQYDEVLSRSSLEEMWREVVPTSEASPLGHEGMGLCFFLYRRDGHRIVGHTGTQASFRSFFLLDPDTGIGVIGVYNTAGGDDSAPDTRGILDGVRKQVVDKLFPLFWND
jgi:CubicO group peptidase (beta-lactamase class C family)